MTKKRGESCTSQENTDFFFVPSYFTYLKDFIFLCYPCVELLMVNPAKNKSGAEGFAAQRSFPQKDFGKESLNCDQTTKIMYAAQRNEKWSLSGGVHLQNFFLRLGSGGIWYSDAWRGNGRCWLASDITGTQSCIGDSSRSYRWG